MSEITSRFTTSEIPGALRQEVCTDSANQLVSFQLLQYRMAQGIEPDDKETILQDQRTTRTPECYTTLTTQSVEDATITVTTPEKGHIFQYSLNEALQSQEIDPEGKPQGDVVTYGKDVAAERAYSYLRDIVLDFCHPPRDET